MQNEEVLALKLTDLQLKPSLSSLSFIENLGCFLRITEEASVWMIRMLDLIGTHYHHHQHHYRHHHYLLEII